MGTLVGGVCSGSSVSQVSTEKWVDALLLFGPHTNLVVLFFPFLFLVLVYSPLFHFLLPISCISITFPPVSSYHLFPLSPPFFLLVYASFSLPLSLSLLPFSFSPLLPSSPLLPLPFLTSFSLPRRLLPTDSVFLLEYPQLPTPPQTAPDSRQYPVLCFIVGAIRRSYSG